MKIRVIVCFLALMVIASGIVAAVVLNNRSTAHIYIALGDSVSSGYGLTGYPEAPQGGHASLFFEKLEQAGYVDEYHNFATSGFTTTDLLEQLNNMSSEEIHLFRNARIVTINIGGNNVLTPFLAYLSDLQIVSGAGTVETEAGRILSGAWGVLYEIASGVGSVVSNEEDANLDVGGVVSGIGDVLSGLGGILWGAGEMIAGTPNALYTWRGSLSPELEAVLEDGVQTFHDELGEIIAWLASNAPDATILVNTVHNPVPQEILMISVPISNWAYALTSYMNQAIVAQSETHGFLVTDVHGHLSQRLYLTSFNISPLQGALSFDLVHPNEAGHTLIAELNYAAFMDAD